MSATLSLRSVGKVWMPEGRQAVEALRGFDLDVAPGEFVVLLGPSGCGKSTLLFMIAGLEDASSGQILFDGEPAGGPSSERGLIFQDASLFPWLTITDNVALASQSQGSARRCVGPVAAEMLAQGWARRHAR